MSTKRLKKVNEEGESLDKDYTELINSAGYRTTIQYSIIFKLAEKQLKNMDRPQCLKCFRFITKGNMCRKCEYENKNTNKQNNTQIHPAFKRYNPKICYCNYYENGKKVCIDYNCMC